MQLIYGMYGLLKGGGDFRKKSVEYGCRRYRTVYGIEAAKVRQWIRNSSVWTLHTAVLNCRTSVSLECTSSPDGECRSVSFGVMKIRKSVVIMRKCKMGGCEDHYLSMTWAARIHSWIGSNKAPKRGKWVVCLSRFACNPEQNEHILLKRWIGCTRIYKLRLKNSISSMIEKTPVWHAQGSIFRVKKKQSFCQSRVESHQFLLLLCVFK